MTMDRGRKVGSWAALFATVCGLVAVGRAQVLIERVDVGNAGVVPDAPTGGADISGDGRVIAFATAATNLFVGDNNGISDIYVRDRATGTTTIESIDSGGLVGFGPSSSPSLSGDGRWIAFETSAWNLAPGSQYFVGPGVIVRDRVTGQSVWASVDPNGAQRHGSNPHLSSDGRFVAFMGNDDDLVPGDTNHKVDVLVRDLVLGTTERVSVASDGTQADNECHLAYRGNVISADGRLVVFASVADNLVGNDTNLHSDVFVHDRLSGQTRRVSVDSAGHQVGLDSYWATITANGRYVSFESMAHQLVPGDTNSAQDAFVSDLSTGAVVRASVGAGNVELDNWSWGPRTSADGRFTMFFSDASNLGAPKEAYMRDFTADATLVLHRMADGQPAAGFSSPVGMSDDARVVMLASDSNMLTGAATPGMFVIDRSYTTPLVYCSAGTSSSGCSASMSWTGSPSASAATPFVLRASGLDGQHNALIFYGIDNLYASPVAWGASSSVLCVKGPRQRTPVQVTGGLFGQCNGAIQVDWNAYAAQHPNALGNPFTAGQQAFAQAWWRDPLGVKTSVLSNALAFTVGP